MKILHVIRDLSPETGGPVAAIRGLSEKQRQLNNEVCIVSTDYGFVEQSSSNEGEVICPCTFNAWRFSPSLKGVLEQKIAWCDVVHIHTVWEYPTLVAVKLARKLDKPFLLRPCGMLDAWSMSQGALKKKLYLKLFSKDLFASNCYLHFTTQAERDKSVFPSCMRTIVVENGVADKAFERAENADAFLGLFPELRGKDIILFLGRVHPKKQPDIALRAFAKIAMDFQHAMLVLAGPCDVAYQSGLKNLANDLGVGEQVKFTGMLNGDELYGAYRSAMVFVLPSMQENFGIAVVEAMAAACPVIVSEKVDIKDYIANNNAGFVCAADPESFATAIKRVLTEPRLGSIIGINGRNLAERCFRWDRAAERLEQIYREIRN